MAVPNLFDATFVERLGRLSIAVRRGAVEMATGGHATTRRGAGIEFEDFRTYVPGDDLRYVDWNAYGRLDALFTKQYREERQVHVAVFLDRSASMDAGRHNKFAAARRVAGALGYVALANFDRVSVYPFAEDLDAAKHLEGKRMGNRLFEFLSGLKPRGKTDLAAAFSQLLHRIKGRGVAVVISDFLDEEGYRKALHMLKVQKYQVHLLHVEDITEKEPNEQGSFLLTDSETGLTLETEITRDLLRRYQEQYEQRCADLAAYCVRNEFGYARIDSAEAFDAVVLTLLERGGILA